LPWRIADRLKAPAPDPLRVRWLLSRTFAHRGLHGQGRVENSPAAFAAAIAAGYGIECDVRKSRDGRAIVFHDERLDRLTAMAGLLADMDVAAITATPFRGGQDCIPTLRDLLQQVGGKVPLLIEIKVDPARSVAALCLAVRRDLEGYAGDHAVMSFDLRGLVVTEEGARTLSGRVRRHRMLWQARPDFLAYDIRDLPGSFPEGQRARGVPLLTWTVNSASLRERAAVCADSAIAEGEGLA
jgi:glycerophosphoryl diester phosphodiesterase